MKAIKKILSLTLALAMGAVALAGCSGNDSSTTSTTGTSSTTSTSSTEAPKTEGGKELVYWSMWNSTEPQGIVIQEAVTAYEAESGNKVTVEWKGRDVRNVMQAALDAKEKIDIIDDDFMVLSKNFGTAALANLDEMAAAVNYESFAVAALPNAVRGWAGNLVCIPYQPYTSGVYYNKATFTKAGITAEPKTWTEFLDVCEKLKASGYVPLAQDDAYVMYTLGFQLARYMGEPAVTEMVKNGTWASTPEALKAANDIQTLHDKGYLSATSPDAYPEGENDIGYDKAAMIVNASWVPGEITNNTQCDIEWGMFNYPTVEGGKDPATVANVGAQAFAIPAYSENQQEAFDLIMKITSGEFDQKMALDSKSIPADTRNTEWPELIANGRDAFNALTNVYTWNMGLGENADIQEILKDASAKLFEGTYSGQQFIDAVQAAYK